MTLPEVLTHFDAVKQRPNGGAQCRCPAHDDRSASLSIDPGKNGGIVVRCFAGCDTAAIVAAAGLTMADLMPPKEAKTISNEWKEFFRTRKILNVYPYTDETGNEQYQAFRYSVTEKHTQTGEERFAPKKFNQRRADPDKPGAFIWNLKGVTRVLYRLPEVLKATQEARRVWVVEGEKDADRLRGEGLTATTNAGGGAGWLPQYTESLRGAHIVVIPDNDPTGKKHAGIVAAALDGKAASVRVLELPNLPDKGDVSDWMNAGGTVAELDALADAAPLWSALPAALKSETTQKFRLTEGGLSERFTFEYADQVRYDHSRKTWFVWTGKRWETDQTGKTQELFKAMVRGLYVEAGKLVSEEERTALLKHAMASERSKIVKDVLSFVATDPKIAILAEKWDSEPFLLNVQNGTIDLRTGKLRPHASADNITRLCAADFDPTATAPLWEKCLERWQPEAQVRDFLRHAAGYSLTGDIGEETAFFVYGTGRNGKSKFTEAIETLLGDYAARIPITALETGRKAGAATPELIPLIGARMVIASELSDGKRLDEAFIKDVTGGDRVTARAMYAGLITFRPLCKIWFYGNHKPVIRGTDEGIWSRLPLIPFGVTIPQDERDPNLSAKLRAEMPGILAWAVRGCLEWQASGLNPPSAVKNATAEYRAEQDTFGRFLSDHCVLAPQASTPAKALRDAYENFMRERGDHVTLNSNQFAERLKQAGCTDARRYFDGRQTRAWMGIGLISDQPDGNSPQNYSLQDSKTAQDGKNQKGSREDSKGDFRKPPSPAVSLSCCVPVSEHEPTFEVRDADENADDMGEEWRDEEL